METKEIARNLNHFVNEIRLGYKGTIDLSLLSEASERLKELESEKENLIHYNADLNNQLNKAEFHIEKLKKQLSEKPEWISVEDGKEMPDAFSYTGIRHNQFPRLVVAIDENSHATHWMMLDAPKPKAKKFRKKPVVVDAYQTEKQVVIHTLEGDMTANVGDYIITGVNGEKYPCKPDIFEKTYEPYFEEEGEQE